MIQNFALGVVAVGLLALPIFLIKMCLDDLRNNKPKNSKLDTKGV